MKLFVNTLFIFFLLSCSNSKTTSVDDVKEKIVKSFYTCELIEKEFENKIGKSGGFKELYLRCSVQDYFIKICESKVTAEQLKKHLNSGIKVEMELKSGNWDICEYSMEHQQSRIGEYVIITKIID
jgi:hypothetical protein